MGYPNNKCMVLTIYIHHMLVDELFDFLNDRIDTPPAYWFSESDAPYSISGGYIAIHLTYDQYAKVRSVKTWADPFESND
jgi:hypothetical protein